MNLASAAPLESAAAAGLGDYRNGYLAATANLGVPCRAGERCRRRARGLPRRLSRGAGERHLRRAADECGRQGHGDYLQAVIAIHQAYLTTGIPPVFFVGTVDAVQALADYVSGVTAAQNESGRTAAEHRRPPGLHLGQRPFRDQAQALISAAAPRRGPEAARTAAGTRG